MVANEGDWELPRQISCNIAKKSAKGELVGWKCADLLPAISNGTIEILTPAMSDLPADATQITPDSPKRT